MVYIYLDRLDRTFEMHHVWTGMDFGEGVMPSDVFRQHILTCLITDPIGLALRGEIGIDNMCWEQDYPHSDSSWRRSHVGQATDRFLVSVAEKSDCFGDADGVVEQVFG